MGQTLEDMLADQELTIYDVLPELGSYLADVEANLQFCAQEYGDDLQWDRYLADPVPFVADLLLDFGEWPDSIPEEEREEEALRLADAWAHPVLGRRA